MLRVACDECGCRCACPLAASACAKCFVSDVGARWGPRIYLRSAMPVLRSGFFFSGFSPPSLLRLVRAAPATCLLSPVWLCVCVSLSLSCSRALQCAVEECVAVCCGVAAVVECVAVCCRVAVVGAVPSPPTRLLSWQSCSVLLLCGSVVIFWYLLPESLRTMSPCVRAWAERTSDTSSISWSTGMLPSQLRSTTC